MRSILLGFRLLVGTGRDSLTRLGLISLGACVGAVALLSLAGIPGVVDAQADRLGALHPTMTDDSDAPLLVELNDDAYGDRILTRVAVATVGPVDPPPWIDRLPEPGELVASPALVELRERDAGLARRFPQQVVGILEEAALVAPDHLYALVGVEADSLPADGPERFWASGFGAGPASSGPDPRAVRLFVVAAAIFLLFPTAAFLTTTARLSARTRGQRLASLRLVGLSRRQTATVAWVEVGVLSLSGAVAGVVVWWLGREPVGRAGIGRIHWFGDDVHVSGIVVAAIIAGLVGLSVLTTQASVRRSIVAPVEDRQPPTRQAVRVRRAVPLAVGLAALAGAAVWQTPSPSSANAWFALFLVGNLASGAGLIFGLPALAVVVGRVLGRLPGGRARQLAAQRLAFEPTAVARTMTGLIVIVFVAGFAQTLLVVLDWTMAETSATEDVPTVIEVSNAGLRVEDLAAIDGVTTAVGRSRFSEEIQVLVGDCDDLAAVATVGSGCDDSVGAQPLTSESHHAAALPQDVRLGSALEVSIAVPGGGSTVGGDYRVPAAGADSLPAPRDWYLGVHDDAKAHEITDAIVSLAPASEVRSGDAPERGRLASTYRSLVTAASTAALVVSLATVIAAVIDRSIERRRQATQLLAVGLPATVLRRSEGWAIGGPLLVALAGTATTAFLSATAYLRFGDPTLRLRAVDLFIVGIIGIIGTVVTTAAAVIATPTRLDPDRLDRE